MDADGQRLNDGADRIVDVLRQLIQEIGVYREVVRACAGTLAADDLELLADVESAGLAEIAFAADLLRTHDDAHARLEVRDVPADLDDVARSLMAHDDRTADERVLAVIRMDIRAANADRAHADERLIVRNFRNRNLANLKTLRFYQYSLFHNVSPSFYSFFTNYACRRVSFLSLFITLLFFDVNYLFLLLFAFVRSHVFYLWTSGRARCYDK